MFLFLRGNFSNLDIFIDLEKKLEKFFNKLRLLTSYNSTNTNKLFNNLDVRLQQSSKLAHLGNACINSVCNLYYWKRDRKYLKKSLKILNDTPTPNLRFVVLEKEFLELARTKDTISFDVFDTLLVRPFEKPKDLFIFIESVEDVPGFAEARTRAEELARKKNSSKGDISYDDIYQEIHPRYYKLKDVELKWERDLIKANPFVRKLYDLAIKMNKRVIAISDMYLPQGFIRDLLESNGYGAFEDIFVSSQYGETKANGGLFDIALNQSALLKSAVLHLGDNLYSDYGVPNSKGITALHIPQLVDFVHLEGNKAWNANLSGINSLKGSVLNSMFACREFSTFFEKIGYFLGGPIVLSYLSYIQREAKACNLDGLLFVARDGWILKNIYDKFYRNESTKSSYVYLNRILGITGLLEWCDEPKYLKTLLEKASKDLPGIEVSSSFANNLRVFEQNKSKLEEASKALRELLYSHVVNEAGKAHRIAVVDTTTGAFSSLRFAKKILGDGVILGIFTGTYVDKSSTLVYSTFFSRQFNTEDTPAIKMLEFLISSPEKPIKSFSHIGPVYGDSEGEKSIAYQSIKCGIEKYCTDYFALFGEKSFLQFEPDEWMILTKNFLRFLTKEEVKNFSKIMFSSEADNSSHSHSFSELFGE